MNNLQVFDNPEFGQVRVVEIDREPWLVGKDVAAALGYSDTNKAIAMHVDDEDKLNDKTSSSLGQRGGWLINESGLYSLVLSSKLPGAKKFRRWVTSEVLPSIRKMGGYQLPRDYPSALRALADAVEENARLEADNQTMRPKANYFDALVDRNLLTSFRETAKEFGVGQNALIRFLLENQYIYWDQKKRLMPYAEHVERGLFELKECKNEQNRWCGTQTLITPRGRETFRLLLNH